MADDKTPAPAKAPRALRYVGPEYSTGIIMPGTSTPVKPKDFTPEEIELFTKENPTAKEWWA